MSFSLIPDYSFDNICCVDGPFLHSLGIRLLLIDLDNTIAPYGTVEPTPEIAAWADDIKKCGIELFIVTNNRKSQRVEALAGALGIGFIKGANKPFSAAIRRALLQMGRSPKETALAGDQIFTDVVAANAAGLVSIVVRPIKILNPALNVRYRLEAPFRALCKNKMP